MAFNPKHYPADWKAIRTKLLARAESRCECVGECGLHTGRRCTECHQKPARWFKGTVALSAAHLCNHGQMCAKFACLKMLCQRCHLRIDSHLHWAHRRESKNQSPSPP